MFRKIVLSLSLLSSFSALAVPLTSALGVDFDKEFSPNRDRGIFIKSVSDDKDTGFINYSLFSEYNYKFQNVEVKTNEYNIPVIISSRTFIYRDGNEAFEDFQKIKKTLIGKYKDYETPFVTHEFFTDFPAGHHSYFAFKKNNITVTLLIEQEEYRKNYTTHRKYNLLIHYVDNNYYLESPEELKDVSSKLLDTF